MSTHVIEHGAAEKSALDLAPSLFAKKLETRKKNYKALMAWIRAELIEGIDYGRFHRRYPRGKKAGLECRDGDRCEVGWHWTKKCLLKAGAEKITGMLGLVPRWPSLPDYEEHAVHGGQIRDIVLRCQLLRDGQVVGEGVGGRTVGKFEDLNKALKMAKKCLGGRTPILIKTRFGIVRTDLHRLFGYKNLAGIQIAGSCREWRELVAISKNSPSSTLVVCLQDGSEIVATSEHRWPLSDGRVITTAELDVGDVLRRDGLPSGEGTANTEIGWICGLFLAEGHREANAAHFSLHAAEAGYAERVGALAQYLGCSWSNYTEGNKRRVSVYGRAFAGLIDHFVIGSRSYGKHWSRWAMRQSRAFLEASLDGYLCGDGHRATRAGRAGHWMLGFTGRNRELADDLRAICAMLDYHCRIGKQVVNDGTGKRHPTYVGWIRDASPKYNAVDLGTVVDIRPGWHVTYDIQVDGDHLVALGNGVVTHNSSLIDAVLVTGGLSEVFTQDIEDDDYRTGEQGDLVDAVELCPVGPFKNKPLGALTDDALMECLNLSEDPDFRDRVNEILAERAENPGLAPGSETEAEPNEMTLPDAAQTLRECETQADLASAWGAIPEHHRTKLAAFHARLEEELP